MLGVHLDRFLHRFKESLVDRFQNTDSTTVELPPINGTFLGKTSASQNENLSAPLENHNRPDFFRTGKCHVNLIPITENIKIYSVSYSRGFCFMETLYSNTVPDQIHTPVFFSF